MQRLIQLWPELGATGKLPAAIVIKKARSCIGHYKRIIILSYWYNSPRGFWIFPKLCLAYNTSEDYPTPISIQLINRTDILFDHTASMCSMKLSIAVSFSVSLITLSKTICWKLPSSLLESLPWGVLFLILNIAIGLTINRSREYSTTWIIVVFISMLAYCIVFNTWPTTARNGIIFGHTDTAVMLAKVFPWTEQRPAAFNLTAL